MNGSGQARVRVLIVARLADPDAENTLGAHARASAERDQQAVGRLTRQDALPGRSMARAPRHGVTGAATGCAGHWPLPSLGPTRTVWGYCADCGGDIPVKRLEPAPTSAHCVSCVAV